MGGLCLEGTFLSLSLSEQRGREVPSQRERRRERGGGGEREGERTAPPCQAPGCELLLAAVENQCGGLSIRASTSRSPRC
jgi:hypothetical protein